MKRKNLADLELGDVIGIPVKTDTKYIPEGTVITDELLKILDTYRINKVYVANLLIEFNKLSIINKSITKQFIVRAESAKNLVLHYAKNLELLYDYDDNLRIHCINVAFYTAMCLQSVIMAPNKKKKIILGALLHDIGKLDVDNAVINKPCKLNLQEYQAIQGHTLKGKVIADELELSNTIKSIILMHHENYDGSGYPNNLKEDEIYYPAQLIHIADVYDAMCSERVYKSTKDRSAVMDLIKNGKSLQFNPTLVELFTQCVPVYLMGEYIDLNTDRFVIIGYDDDANPVFQSVKNKNTISYNSILKFGDFDRYNYTLKLT